MAPLGLADASQGPARSVLVAATRSCLAGPSVNNGSVLAAK